MGPPRDSAGAGGPRNRPTTGECRGLPFVADPVKRVGSQRRNAHPCNRRHSAESAREKRGGDVAGVGPPLVGRIVPGSFASFVGTLDHWFDDFFGETRWLLQACPACWNGSNSALSVV